jgi:chemotaxis protein MotB
MPDEKIELSPATRRGSKKWLVRFILATLFCLAAAVGLGYYGWTVRAERNTLQSELALSKASAKTCSGELADTKLSNTSLQGKLDTCNKARGESDAKRKATATSAKSLSEDLNATKKELEELRKQRAETARRLAAFKDMTAKFRKMIDSGKLNVEVRQGRMVVKLPAGVLFPSGSAELSRSGELALMEVAVILRGFPKRRFMIIGHTDSRPLESSKKSKYKDNWDLSAARAVRVTRFLIEAKLAPKNLLAAGHAQFDPVASNRTSKGRQANRRIEIVLLPNLEELPTPPATGRKKPGKR